MQSSSYLMIQGQVLALKEKYHIFYILKKNL
jgi:hypothetical protein